MKTHFKKLRVACVTAALGLSVPANAGLISDVLPDEIAGPLAPVLNPLEAVLDPTAPDADYDFTQGELYTNSIYALGVSHFNILKYYRDARERYGELPPAVELTDAVAGWDTYLVSNIPALNVVFKRNNPPLDFGGAANTTPEIPLVNREVTPINKVDGFRKPLVPPMRFTRDGRIGVVPGMGGLDGEPAPLQIMLQRPEGLDRHILESAPGIPSMDPDVWEVKDYDEWGLPGSNVTQFAAVCEAEPSTPQESNPYSCGNDDCYDFTLIGSAVDDTFNTSGQNGLDGGYQTLFMPQLESGDRLYSREVTIRVSEPKTSNARITAVDFSDEYRTAPIQQGVLFEPTTPADGRLFVARRQGLPLVWRHSTTGEMRGGSYETVYAVAPDSAAPCDVREWGDLKPISHAPFDPEVRDRYGFAKYPFRDPMGNLIPDGEDIKGTYPWVDMDAKMMSLMISDANLFRNTFRGETPITDSRFPATCVHSDCSRDDSQEKANIAQFTVMGAWTNGKMVLFDNNVNFADFRIGLDNAVNIDIYDPGSALPETENKSSIVEVGAYREVGVNVPGDEYVALRDESGAPILGRDGSAKEYLLKNTSLFDSIEHRLNYNPHMKPGRPHDVLWLVSSGATSDELNFDDMLNNHAFIVSEMVAAHAWDNNSRFRMTVFDGWHEATGTFTGQVKLQNSAATLPDSWVVPDAGHVFNGRMEPVANGGIKGKGLYFNGSDTRVEYTISPDQPRSLGDSDWFHSLFLDTRGLNESEEQAILQFPDNSLLTMADDQSAVIFNAYDKTGTRVDGFRLPSDLVVGQWLHLALYKPSEGPITVYVNGYPFAEIPVTDDSMFGMQGGTLVLGQDSNAQPSASVTGFKGWMDDYKVFSYKPDPESVCNLAHGTLVAPGTNAQVTQQAGLYSSEMHNRITRALELRGQPTYSRYACFMDDPASDRTAVKHRLPTDVVSIRESIHFPEGPIYHDAPRPDSSTNEFCLACHSEAEDKIRGLSVDALRFREMLAKVDPRRQPLQPEPFITGTIPMEFIRSINGDPRQMGSSYIDEYLLPSSEGVSPEVRNLVLVENGEFIEPIDSCLMVIKHASRAVRVNASGLATRAVFRVNGEMRHEDNAAPFELPVDVLDDGTNRVEFFTYASDGTENRHRAIVMAESP